MFPIFKKIDKVIEDIKDIKRMLEELKPEILSERIINKVDNAFITESEKGLNYHVSKYRDKFKEMFCRDTSIENLINKMSFLIYRYTIYSSTGKLDFNSILQFKLEFETILIKLGEFNPAANAEGFDGMCVLIDGEILTGKESLPRIEFIVINDILTMVKIPHLDMIVNIKVNGVNVKESLLSIINKDICERRS